VRHRTQSEQSPRLGAERDANTRRRQYVRERCRQPETMNIGNSAELLSIKKGKRGPLAAVRDTAARLPAHCGEISAHIKRRPSLSDDALHARWCANDSGLVQCGPSACDLLDLIQSLP